MDTCLSWRVRKRERERECVETPKPKSQVVNAETLGPSVWLGLMVGGPTVFAQSSSYWDIR